MPACPEPSISHGSTGGRRPAAALDTACELALEAIRRDSLDGRGFSELGFAHLYKKRHDGSLAAYARAIELYPNDPWPEWHTR
jgi:tetratricopeptide (TPR) repeat protein